MPNLELTSLAGAHWTPSMSNCRFPWTSHSRHPCSKRGHLRVKSFLQ